MTSSLGVVVMRVVATSSLGVVVTSSLGVVLASSLGVVVVRVVLVATF